MMEDLLTILAGYTCIVIFIYLASDDETDLPSDLVDRRYGLDKTRQKETE